MKRIAACAWLISIAVAALGLFHIKHQVQRLEAELGLAQQSILEHREAIHVLKAEWSYLNQPTRISDLAVRHLDMAPMTAAQIIDLADLPTRGATPSDSQAAPSGATLASTETSAGRSQ